MRDINSQRDAIYFYTNALRFPASYLLFDKNNLHINHIYFDASISAGL